MGRKKNSTPFGCSGSHEKEGKKKTKETRRRALITTRVGKGELSIRTILTSKEKEAKEPDRVILGGKK